MQKYHSLNIRSLIIRHYILKLAFVFLLITTPLHADPHQRIIINFSHALTSENINDLNNYFSNQLTTDFSLAEHSSNQRWIIIFHATFNKTQIDEIIHTLMKKKYVKYVEEDKLLTKD